MRHLFVERITIPMQFLGISIVQSLLDDARRFRMLNVKVEIISNTRKFRSYI